MPVPATSGQLRTAIADMRIGDYIACEYTATSGAIGYFNKLGESVAAEIAVGGSATPNGKFYFIKADRGLLIADRVIQHSITWDILNSYNYIQGSRYFKQVKLANPDVLPTGTGNGITFSPDGNYMAVAHTTTPFVTIYKRNGDTFTKLADPDVLPAGSGQSVSFSSDGIYMAVAHTTTPFVTIYKRNGDTFTKLANPASLPVASNGYGVSFSLDVTYMAITHDGSPYVTIYKRSGDTFTKLANPDVLPTGVAYGGVSFSSDGTYMAVAHDVSPYVTIYKRSGDTFTKLANPDVLPAGTCFGITFSPDGNYMMIAQSTASPVYFIIYKRNGDAFTKLTNTGALAPAGTGRGVAFSSDGNYMAVASITSPYITIGKRDGDKLSKLANPTISPAGTGRSVAFSPDGIYMAVAHSTTPFITIYKNILNGVIRCPLGGIAYADSNNNLAFTNSSKGAFPTNNEWDTYIVNSDLEENITKGNDNTWHWLNILSTCGDTPSIDISTSDNRIFRGNLYAADVVIAISNATSTVRGFRPVLEYEEV